MFASVAPGASADDVAFNWQQRASAPHAIPQTTALGDCTITGVRAHAEANDHTGPYAAVNATFAVFVNSLSLAVHTTIGPDGSPIGPNEVRFDAHQLSSLLKRHLDSRRRALHRQHGSCGSLSTAFVDQFSKHGCLLCERSRSRRRNCMVTE